MPRISVPLYLHVSLEDGYEDLDYDDKTWSEHNKQIYTLLNTLTDLTGIKADDQVDLQLSAQYYNGKILLDWHPFHNKAWYFTTGVYFGPSKIGEAENYARETSFLQALNAYNRIYYNVLEQREVIKVGEMGAEFPPEINEKFLNFGPATFYIGPKNDGSYYHTKPQADGTVHADCYTNAFKPYLGFGHDSPIGKSGRCTLSFECGALFWGGTPRIITHDGIDLAHDMQYIKKTILRHIVDGVSALQVMPNLELRLSWQIF